MIAVAHSSFWRWVYFDDQSVGASGDSCGGHVGDQVSVSRSVRGINHDGQVSLLSQVGNGGQRQSESSVTLEGADTPFAKHDVRISLIQNVFGSQQQFVHSGAGAAFEQDRSIGISDCLEESIVLHISGTDLQNIRVFCDEIDVIGRHDFGNNGESCFFASCGEQFQAFFFHPLETVGTGARFECSATQRRGARCPHGFGSLQVGAGKLGVIAGPCSVEGEEQIISTAKAVRAAGATALRGGAFKPRTSPYSFQGMKEEGLKLLAAAREETGLAVVTEIMSTDDVDLVAEYSDVLQIGARNMQNYRLLEAVGNTDRAVLLKRGASATMDELLLAAEYILNEGNPNVMLCERGIRTFESHTRFTLPLASVPYLRQKTHLPVVIDPSHGTGHTYLVPDMATAAVAAGADGLIVEVHPTPETAMSDGYQSMTFPQFEAMMVKCRKVANALDIEM